MNALVQDERVERNRKYYKLNPEKMHARALKHNYGMTLDDYREMLKQQNGRCLICKIHHDDCRQGKLHVDHCHSRDKVRGLLCEHCNRMLGLAKENPETLIAGAKYLAETSD